MACFYGAAKLKLWIKHNNSGLLCHMRFLFSGSNQCHLSGFAIGAIMLAIVVLAAVIAAISFSMRGVGLGVSSSESARAVASGLLYQMESLRTRAENAYRLSDKSFYDFYTQDVRVGGFFFAK